MASPAADRNLLFGILALQMDFISRDALIAGMHAWILNKGKPLGRILVEQNHLAADVLALLDALVEKHLQQHGNDAQQSLAALPLAGADRDELRRIGDGDVQASLAAVAGEPVKDVLPDGEEVATRSFSVGVSTSSGLRFQVLRPWAEGGLGKVSVARDEELHREVALKEIKEKHADDPAGRRRFLLEAEITGGLEHPGIVPVYGLGAYADGRPFYAMRFIRGDSLKDAIARFHRKDEGGRMKDETDISRESHSSLRLHPSTFASLEFRQLLGRFVDVCNAIAYAHSRGVLHRDLKPGNIMLGKYGETLVVDWGLAKAVGTRQEQGGGQKESGVNKTGAAGASPTGRDPAAPPTPSLSLHTDEAPLQPSSGSELETVAGTAVGTPAFMSPEQAAGRLDLLSAASDVYSLGATLFAIFTGKPPLKNMPTPDVLRAVQQGDIPAPRQLQPNLPRALDAVCRRAMALRAADRYESPRTLADDIEHWLADEPVSAWPEPWTVKTRRWIGRNRVIAASVAAAVVVSAGLLLVGNVLLSKANADLENANQSISNANVELEKAIGAKQIANEKLSISEKEARAAAAREKEAHDATAQTLAVSYMMLARLRFEEHQAGLAQQWLQKVDPALRRSPWQLLQNYVAGSLFTLTGHSAPVADVSVSPDGRWLASASWDHTVKLWDARTGQEGRTLRGHTGFVTAVAFSPDGRWLASASFDRTVRLWDAWTGQERLTLRKHTLAVNDVAFSPDGLWLASAGADRSIKIWDVRTGALHRDFVGHTKGVAGVAFSRDGKWLVSASADKTVKRWEWQTDAEIRTYQGRGLGFKGVAISPDGRWLAGAGLDGTASLWDTRLADEPRVLKGHTGEVSRVNFSPDGQWLVSSSADGLVKLWEVHTGQEWRTFAGHAGAANSVAFSPDGERLISASHDKTVKVWHSQPGEALRTLRGSPGLVASVAVSPDGRWFASGHFDQTVKLWDAWTGRELRSLEGHKGPVNAVAISGNGRWLVSASSDSTATLWDAHVGVERHSLQGHADGLTSVAFGPDDSWLATASLDGSVKLWNAVTGVERTTLRGHEKPVLGVAISPDGRRLASGSFDKTVRIWSVGSDGTPRVLNGHTGAVNTVAISPDGLRLASGSDDQSIVIWDLATGDQQHVLRGHTAKITSVAFSPDSQWLASASYDGTVNLWDAKTGQELRTLGGHTRPVAGVAVSPVGPWLVSVSHDGALKIWDARTDTSPNHELRFRHWATAPDLHLRRDQFEKAKKGGAPATAALHLAWYLAGQAEWAAPPRRAAASAGYLGLAHQLWMGIGASPSLTPPQFDAGRVLTAVLTNDAGPERTLAKQEALYGIAIEPMSGLNRALYGAVLYRTGDHAKALEELQHAVKLRDQAWVWPGAFLALAQARTGQFEPARQWLKHPPRADAPWEEKALFELLRPEVEQAQSRTP